MKDVQPSRLMKEYETVWEQEAKQKGRRGNADNQHQTKETVTQFWIQEGTQFTFMWACKNRPTCFLSLHRI